MKFVQNKSFRNGVRSRDSAVLPGENIPLWNVSRRGSQACRTSYFPQDDPRGASAVRDAVPAPLPPCQFAPRSPGVLVFIKGVPH